MSASLREAVVLKNGRDKPVRHHHPWIFSGAIQQIPEGAADGSIVPVVSAGGEFLAQGYLNRRSQIQVRLLSWDAAETIDAAFWRRRLQAAIHGRSRLPDRLATNALRLVNAENDYLPGLTVDRCADYLVLQAGTLAIDQRKQMLADLLLELTSAQGVVERSEMAARKQEGLGAAAGLLAGTEPPAQIEIVEHGCRFVVDLLHGQKTGFYTDQRANRQRVAAYARGQHVLNAFAYTGAFAVHCLAAGAQHVTNVDSSVPALELAEENLRRNGFDPDSASENIAGDVFAVLREWQNGDPPTQNSRQFGVVILDPPKFVQSQQHMERALRGYKDINRLGCLLAAPGGLLATFSCSGLVGAELFQQVVFGAAEEAGRRVQVLERLHQGPDHPVALTFPEGEYLKGLLCRVL